MVIEQGRRRCALFALAVCSRRLLLFWRWFDGGLLVATAASHSRRGGAVLSVLAARTVAETLLVTVVSGLVLLRERWRSKLGTRGGGENGGTLLQFCVEMVVAPHEMQR